MEKSGSSMYVQGFLDSVSHSDQIKALNITAETAAEEMLHTSHMLPCIQSSVEEKLQ